MKLDIKIPISEIETAESKTD